MANVSNREINCVIVEDDEVSLQLMKGLIEKTPFLKLENSFSDSIEASKYLKENKVALIFLDIEMPTLSGFELIKLLDYKPAVIVITAKQHYAAEAFDYDVHDFLVKPVVDYSRFLKSVLSLESTGKPKPDNSSNVFVKADSQLHNIVLENILYVEAFGDYIKIHTDNKVLMVLSTLISFEGKVPADHFVRVHRSFIVNIKHIKNIESTNLHIANKIIPISTNYREDLLSKINLI